MKDKNSFNSPFETINTLMNEKGMSAERLSYLTEVPKRFILLLQSGGFQDLPSRPYVIAYLKKIASTLGIDEQSLISEYENAVLKKNGGDKFPSNRFAGGSIGFQRFAIAAVIIWGLAAFLGYRFDQMVGVPSFKVNFPSSVSSSAMEISGRLNQGDGVTINGQAINTDANGYFSTTVYLAPGVNSFDFAISRFLGGQAAESVSIYYSPSS